MFTENFTINLVNKPIIKNEPFNYNMQIGYNIIEYPDKQRAIEIFNIPQSATSITIKSRFSFADLEIIKQVVVFIRQFDPKIEINLEIPYFLGARADRRFKPEMIHYLRDVSAHYINDLKVDRVYVLDPHSDVLEACIPNLVKISPAFITQIATSTVFGEEFVNNKDFYYISPDAGASKKIGKIVAENLDSESKIIIGGKTRDDQTGELKKFWIPKDDLEGKTCFIIDDICSKGGTFMGLAGVLKEHNAGDIYLVVSHYEGTAKTEDLKKAGIKKVFTTNSVCDIDDPMIEQFNVF